MSKLVIKNARLSFPALFRKAVFNGEETKFEATLLLDKDTHADVIAQIKTIMKEACAEKKMKLPPADKLCLRDGDEQDYDGYENMMSLKAASNRRPTVLDRDKTPIVEEDGIIYAGCYVNASVDFWVMNNRYGKRVCCNLNGIQFSKHGDAFGAGGGDAADDFDEIYDEPDF